MLRINITVCIGSGCHVKGSRGIINILQGYIAENEAKIEIKLKACFCQGHCTEGVVVKFNEEIVTNITKDNIIDELEKRLDI
ncbi:NAD(P)H-dependent oxidoreductase subunit E [Iocasia frigidifontis]|uniref:NAD(P)H-dependent oxidoreductase subunit E n=1 Tax=Iocasia fonsfrigidae TaxID=2682810 RepID=UPI001E54CF26|nr:NAD(P)H-dependent oxidoreductase subunit E [Iocasia fonsfrigidae]